MNGQKTGFGRTTTTLLVLLIAGIAVAIGAYYYFAQTRAAPEVPPTPPSTEWTTAPEGGVAVDLPQTTMTNTPPEQDDPEEYGEEDR